MYAVVLSTCKKHQAIWSNVPAFAASVNALEAKLGEFTQTAEERLKDISNVTKSKARLLDTLHEKMYGVIRIIQSYALHDGLEDLATEYSISKTNLKIGGAKAEVNRYNNVVDKATELAADLEEFGLNGSVLTGNHAGSSGSQSAYLQPRLPSSSEKCSPENSIS